MNKLLTTKLSHLVLILFFISLLTSCNDEYYFEENIPSWLGKSIYDYLENEGNYTTYIRLIDDLDYTEVLAKTGSKTLFVADDEAFSRFYANNSWGVKRYEDFTSSQKKVLLRSSMINSAILLEGLSTIQGPVDGQALRRETNLLVTDSIPFEDGSNLPGSSYWDRFRTKGIYLAKDNSAIPMLHFLDKQMQAKSITAEDFSILFNGASWNKGDAYVYNVKVREGDITCQNGYIHILEDVMIPPSNMAQVISEHSEIGMFSSFLERFAAPYYSETLTEQYRLLGGNDSVFVKGYFSERSSIVPYNSSSKNCTAPDLIGTVPDVLSYDPGWNRYYVSDNTSPFTVDMGAIFAPTDAALKNYFESGSGKALIERYGSIENIPNEVLKTLVRNHMKTTFLSTIPSLFYNVVDDAQEVMGVESSHVEKTYLASNGVVYVTNMVYSPALYSSVMFPATINENMKVFNWAISQLNFDAYLLSMVNYYSFLLPTDNFMYILPNSVKSMFPRAWKFKYDNVRNSVYASVHNYDPETHIIEDDSIDVVTSSSLLLDHLEDMLDYHIIVGNIEDGKDFYRTKGNGTVRVNTSGSTMQVAGGGDIMRNTPLSIGEIYDQTKETNGRGNGKTYVIDQPVQSPVRSVYEVLSTTPEFSEFFTLLQGNDDLWEGDDDRAARYSVFYMDASQAGMDLNVRFLSTYHYTLYIPTNDQVRNAIQTKGLPTWDDVENETDQDERDALAEKIIRFVRYHFQDNAVFLDKYSASSRLPYETATLNLETETFYRLYLDLNNYSLNINTESGGTAQVMKDNGLYNIMARDFKFNSATVENATMIETSAYVVIHQIDKCLYFE